MNLYDAMKDAIRIAQKADNIELYRQLLDLSAQALDLQAELSRVREENERLKRKQDISNRITRHEALYVTLMGENPVLRYCSHCWDSNEQLIQLDCDMEDGSFVCPHCRTSGIYNLEKYKRATSDSCDDNQQFLGYLNYPGY